MLLLELQIVLVVRMEPIMLQVVQMLPCVLIVHLLLVKIVSLLLFLQLQLQKDVQYVQIELLFK